MSDEQAVSYRHSANKEAKFNGRPASEAVSLPLFAEF
jgi:hypothetical protein